MNSCSAATPHWSATCRYRSPCIGDGDFGYSLARGFEKLLERWDEIDGRNAGTFLKKAGIAITSRIGGTWDPIWGTAFLPAGMAAGDSPELAAEQALALLRAAIEGIKTRGQSDVGDKRLLDALAPFTDRFEDELRSGTDGSAALAAAASAARPLRIDWSTIRAAQSSSPPRRMAKWTSTLVVPIRPADLIAPPNAGPPVDLQAHQMEVDALDRRGGAVQPGCGEGARHRLGEPGEVPRVEHNALLLVHLVVTRPPRAREVLRLGGLSSSSRGV